MKNLSRAAAILAVVITAACDQPESEAAAKTEEVAPAPKKLTPAQLKETVEGNKPYFFLDVRSAEEIAELGTLEGYVNIPIGELEARLSEIPKGIPVITA